MILYVNGDEHTAAAQAINNFSFANDDFSKVVLGHKPHPDNLAVSWGSQLSKFLKLALVCEAESYSSNERIFRTTSNFLETMDTKKYPYLMMVIGWTDWTRAEFLNSKNEYIQVNTKSVPEEDIYDNYRTYIKNLNYEQRQEYWHEKIWGLHKLLEKRSIPHLFFNSVDSFENANLKHKNWKECYIDPYSRSNNFSNWLRLNQYKPNSNLNYNADAHRDWANQIKTRLMSN